MAKRKKMRYDISFQEMSKLAKELLSKQPPTTLEKARAQAERVKIRIAGKDKKTAPDTDKKNS